MSVRFAEGPPGHAAQDVVRALRAAEDAGDGSGVETILRLLGGHLQEELGEKSREALERYLRSRRVWREWDTHAVFKTGGAPCFAYVALEQDGVLMITVLGCCYRYPVSEAAWWQDVILPRLRRYV